MVTSNHVKPMINFAVLRPGVTDQLKIQNSKRYFNHGNFLHNFTGLFNAHHNAEILFSHNVVYLVVWGSNNVYFR